MMSFRAITRAAPRTTSRITTTSSIRPAIQTALRPRITTQTPRIATFATTRARFDEHSQQLGLKLQQEISIETEETAQSAGSDTNVEQFKADHPYWEIKDTDGEQDVFLTRKFEDEDITVHFSIADFNQQMYNEDEMDTAMADEAEDMDLQSGGANTKGSINRGGTANQNFKVAPEDSIAPADREELRDQEDEAQPAYPVGVQVLIQRPNKGALKFDLVASDGDFMIQQLVQLPKGKTTDAAELLRAVPENLYTGPPFQQLDEEVQGILESYLASRGFTNHLALFIPDYIDVKEQKEYLGWLNRVKDFVE